MEPRPFELIAPLLAAIGNPNELDKARLAVRELAARIDQMSDEELASSARGIGEPALTLMVQALSLGTKSLRMFTAPSSDTTALVADMAEAAELLEQMRDIIASDDDDDDLIDHDDVMRILAG